MGLGAYGDVKGCVKDSFINSVMHVPLRLVVNLMILRGRSRVRKSKAKLLKIVMRGIVIFIPPDHGSQMKTRHGRLGRWLSQKRTCRESMRN